MDTLGDRLRGLRAEHEITQAELAKRNPSTEIIGKLSDYFEVSTDYLLNGSYSEDDRLHVKEWRNLTSSRSDREIKSALKLVQSFFESVDEAKK